MKIGQVPRGPQHARRVQGASGRVHGCLREVSGSEGVHRIFPVSLLPQGLRQKELLWKLSLKWEQVSRDKISSAINALFKCIKTQMEEDLTVQKTMHYRHQI